MVALKRSRQWQSDAQPAWRWAGQRKNGRRRAGFRIGTWDRIGSVQTVASEGDERQLKVPIVVALRCHILFILVGRLSAFESERVDILAAQITEEQRSFCRIQSHPHTGI